MKCAYCGEEFEATDKRFRYCSTECQKAAYRERQRKENKKRRKVDAEYRAKTYEGNRLRYHAKKHQRFVDLANEIRNNNWDEASLVEFLDSNFRLRH